MNVALFAQCRGLLFLRVHCYQHYAEWGMLPLLQTWTASVRRKRSWLINLILPELIKQWDVLGFCCLSWWVLIITNNAKPQHISLGSKLPSNIFPLKINSIVMEPVYYKNCKLIISHFQTIWPFLPRLVECFWKRSCWVSLIHRSRFT